MCVGCMQQGACLVAGSACVCGCACRWCGQVVCGQNAVWCCRGLQAEPEGWMHIASSAVWLCSGTAITCPALKSGVGLVDNCVIMTRCVQAGDTAGTQLVAVPVP
jgi:hypothetical protein